MSNNGVRPLHITSLGSSFAAGPGIKPIAERRASRSGANYPHQLAESLGATLTDLSVSGASTATILDTPQRLGFATFPPQVDGVPAHSDVVTITAGGNDLRYALSLLKAGWGGWFHEHRLTRRLGARISADVVPVVQDADVTRAADGLARIVDSVRERAAGARILLVDYLTVIGPQSRTSPEIPFDQKTITGFRDVGLRLNDAFALAAAKSSAELVRTSAASESHAVGSLDPWVVGFAPRFSGITAFHPNERGMAAVARLVREQLSDQPT